ncbi:N-acetylneuraminate synthase family protein [Candidatus Nitronereus thalassa]|uniref:N-acetylneuraminate synthase family protein n=2 Tax=Candidatus Nitronereus thalassa TaxID=3020898 RepID=A0ABU3K555_9BACT|nr:N-acetylneuraminate synthase family protein [Candidatus Nitronereus thalassa]MDT7041539.1 N-acetylneuraminate synthase family protein [Candidatus Nitronereus thalassa]
MMDKIKQAQPPVVIAEIGCNHKGDLGIAKEMIRIAKLFCNVEYVKFQKRNSRELMTDEQYNSPHPVPYHSYGETYGQHREFLEFDIDQHAQLKEYCEGLGIGYSCSVWDMTSLKEIMELNLDHIKIPSAINTHWELLEHMCRYYKGDIHISLGMTTYEEQGKIIQLLQNHKRLQDVVLYHCTSGYPVPHRDICLLGIRQLVESLGERVKAIGFSAHYTGIGLDGAAYVLGAQYIERHFTLDRSWKGTDHAASLEPDGLRRVRKDTIAIAEALRNKDTDILDIELPQRKKLKWQPKESVVMSASGF